MTSEPQATWKADRQILEWVLPTGIESGGEQVLQARLSMDKAEVRVAAITPTASVMVNCHLLDSTFSSVDLEVSGTAGAGDVEVAGKVMKRCRIQCRQQA